MSSGPHLIENPLSGERILIRRTAAETGGALLEWELFLAPGGRVPSSHAHPEQEECFTVLAGRMRFRVGRRSLTVGAGETVRIPPGTVHHFANAGNVRAHLAVQTRPALDMETLLRTAAALARQQHAAARALPYPVDLALFMHDFEREVRAPYLPVALVHLFTRPVAWLARRCNLDTRYRQLRPPALPRQSSRPAVKIVGVKKGPWGPSAYPDNLHDLSPCGREDCRGGDREDCRGDGGG